MSKENKKTQPKNDELLEWKNLALRMKADYENREKEIAKEKSVLHGLVEENLICDFLPVLDNLNSVLNAIEKDSAWKQGIEHIKKQFEDLLHQRGVEKMDLLGEEFNPALAEAVERVGDGNKIVKVLVDGYKKDERIIRPARVVVGERE